MSDTDGRDSTAWVTGFLPSAWVPNGLVGLGGVLLAVAILEVGAMASGGSFTVAAVANLLTGLPFVALLLAGGRRLPRSVVSTGRYPRIAGWTLAGLAFFGGFFTLIAFLTLSGLWVRIGAVWWGVSVGAGSGFLVGFVNARSTERAVSAERADVRAEEIERRRELLEYMNALLRHEVLNTANVIQGYAALLEDRLEEESIEREHAGVIRRQAAGLTDVTEEVKLLLEASGEATTTEPIEVGEIVREELRDLRDRHPGVEIETDLPEEAFVEAGPLLRRLFSNLFENAVEHDGGDGARVSVTAALCEERVRIHVEDDGPGIPEAKRAELFEPVSEEGTGHGLGLLIVDRLAERYGGRVDLVETGPEGSTFRVELPRAEAPGEDGEASVPSPAPPETVDSKPSTG